MVISVLYCTLLYFVFGRKTALEELKAETEASVQAREDSDGVPVSNVLYGCVNNCMVL